MRFVCGEQVPLLSVAGVAGTLCRRLLVLRAAGFTCYLLQARGDVLPTVKGATSATARPPPITVGSQALQNHPIHNRVGIGAVLLRLLVYSNLHACSLSTHDGSLLIFLSCVLPRKGEPP